jgi:hypothetical protein
MKRITYLNTTALVGNEFADLLLEFAAALARKQQAETVHFLGISDQGVQEFTIVVGPASELAAVTVDSEPGVEPPANTDASTIISWRLRDLEPESPLRAGIATIGEPAA